MAPSKPAFRGRFRALSPADATDFLADLYAAQGFAVERGEGRLTVARDGVTRTVALAGATDPSAADVVVTRGDGAGVPDGAESIGPEDLYDRTRYAVDAAASERLLETYFDGLPEAARPPPADEPTSDGDPHPAGPASDANGGRSALETWSRRALLVAGGALLGGGVAALGAMAPLDGATGAATPEPVETPTPSPSVAVPGLSSDGVADPSVLADAHAAAADAQSYTLSLSEYRHDDALELRSAIGLDLSISADRGYLAIVQTAGPDAPRLLGRPPARSVYWSDGDDYYVDHRPDSWGGISSFRPLRGWVGTWQYWAHVFAFGGTIDSAPTDYFHSLFDAVPTRLVGRDGDAGDPRYRLVGRAPAPEADLGPLAGSNHRDIDLSAVVDGAGFVRSHEVSYRAQFDSETGRVRRSLAFTRVGETTVTRPIWAD